MYHSHRTYTKRIPEREKKVSVEAIRELDEFHFSLLYIAINLIPIMMQRYLSRRCVTIPMLRAAAAHRAANKGCEVRPRGEAEKYGRSHLACTALIPEVI